MRTHGGDDKVALLKRLEGVLLIVCLCVLAVRSMYIESPHADLINPGQVLTNEAFSVVISSVLVLAVVAWFLVAFCSGRFVYRFSGIEIAAGLFFVAGVVGVVVASNKRAAITDMVTLLAPMLTAILLIQILDSFSKIRLVLLVVLALGAATTYQCVDQLLTSNEDMIEFYEQDPEASLQAIGAAVGSFEQMLYEHRLYGKDIRGFLTTSNSTGSFLVLVAFGAVGLLIDAVRNRKERGANPVVICLGVGAVIVAAGLVITHSKGAIGAAFVCALVMVVTLALGKVLYRFRWLVLVMLIVVLIAGAVLVFCYGRTHETLPGGASMLVRWQYWEGAARMYADEPFTGVGGGNFSSYYPHYKIAAAPETVSDPHNFALALLSQYGPLGLIGFVAGIAIVLFRSVFSRRCESENEHESRSGAKPWATLVLVCLALLVLRPVLYASPLGDNVVVMISVVIVLYVIPVAVFAVAFWLLWRVAAKDLRVGRATQIGLLCGIGAVLIHNLIDFAIFESAVLTLFWTMVGCLFAMDSVRKNRGAIEVRCGRIQRIAAFGMIAVFGGAYLHFALAPTVKAGLGIQRALKEPYLAHGLFDKAADDDVFSPAALSLGGKAYLRHYNEAGRRQTELLSSAMRRFESAVERDRASFKNYEKVARVCEMLADAGAGGAQSDLRRKALEQLKEAVRLYPGSGRLNFRLAELAEEIGDDEIALSHYRAAVEIEDSYRVQFRIMYPGREMFSRLGETKYRLAMERIGRVDGE